MKNFLLLLLIFSITNKSFAQSNADSCNIQAHYTWKLDSINHQKINFINNSAPIAINETASWSFGDNSTASTSWTGASHEYANMGKYYACLKIQTSSTCYKYFCDTVLVPMQCTLVANFNTQADPVTPNKIYFVNSSTPSSTNDSTRWSFGDGTYSTAINPYHIYVNAGTYNVCLNVKKQSTAGTTWRCAQEICKPIIVAAPCNIQAHYTWKLDSLNHQKINFINNSAPIAINETASWSFGDNSTASTSWTGASHEYANMGKYYACLKIQTSSTCYKYFCDTVVVPMQCTLVANFNTQADPVTPNKIYFVNSSTPSSTNDSTRWSFGDGTYSTAINPYHIYVNAGTYNVCLNVKKQSTAGTTWRCMQEICKPIIVAAPCNIQAHYTWKLDSLNHQKINFINNSAPIAINETASWSFGDNSTASTSLTGASHEYPNDGKYYACLKIQTSSTCYKYFCDTVLVPMQCTLVANFNTQADPVTPNKIYFVNSSTPSSTNDSTRWSFGDGTYSTAINPYHIYANAGTYNVCLNINKQNPAVTSVRCLQEICKTIMVKKQVNYYDIRTYPNPTTNIENVRIYLTQPLIIYANIYNMQQLLVGQQSLQGSVGYNLFSIPVSQFNQGIYIIKFIYGDKTSYTKFEKH